MKKQRAKRDTCNICSEIANLTWDHVPPKFCNNYSAKEYTVAFGMKNKLSSQKLFPLTVQNGVRYRSICAHCNSQLLGMDTDPAYKALVDGIIMRIRSDSISQHEFSVDVQVNRLSRSVVGHLLAAKNFYDKDCIVDKQLRKFFMNTQLCPPKNMQLYCFLYPYDTLMIARDVCPLQSKNTPKDFAVPHGMISCLYSFPIAFLLTRSSPRLPFADIFDMCSSDINEKRPITLAKGSLFFPNTNITRSPFWPCNISNTVEGSFGVLAGTASEDLVMARNKRVKNQ